MFNPIDYSISKFISFLDDKTLAEIHDIAEIIVYSKSSIIETRGDFANYFYLIDQGLVALGIHGEDGSLFNLARLGPGHTFGDTEFFLGHEVIYDASAETDVVLYKLSKENIDLMMTNSLVFSKALVSVACTPKSIVTRWRSASACCSAAVIVDTWCAVALCQIGGRIILRIAHLLFQS